MRTKCKLCNQKFRSKDDRHLCQTPKHRPNGEAYCGDCSKQREEGFHQPFICNECHENPEPRPTIPAHRRVAKKKKRKHNRRLSVLRAGLALRQDQMARRLGISTRRYQYWESDEDQMPTVACLLCYQFCVGEYADFAQDWTDEYDESMADV